MLCSMERFNNKRPPKLSSKAIELLEDFCLAGENTGHVFETDMDRISTNRNRERMGRPGIENFILSTIRIPAQT